MVLPSVIRSSPSLCHVISVGGAVLVSQVSVRVELKFSVFWKLVILGTFLANER